VVKRYGVGTFVALAVTVVVWSTTFAGLVAALRHFTPDHLLFLRWTLTCVLMSIYGAFTGVRLPARRDLPQIALAGLLGVGAYQYALVHGQAGVPATVAGFIINLSPVFTLLLAVALKREKATPFVWAGLAVSLGGLVLMGMGKGGFAGGSLPSAGLVAFAALCYGAYSLVIKPLLGRYTPLEVTLYALIAGTIPFLLLAPGSVHALATASTADLAVLFFLSIGPGGIAFVLWSRIVHAMTPALATRFLYLIPVLGIGVAWVWVGEVPAAVTVIGGLVTVAGVALAAVRRSPNPALVPARPPHADLVHAVAAPEAV